MAYDFESSPQWSPIYSLSGSSQGLLPQSHQSSQPLQSSWTHGSPYHLSVKQQPERAKVANAKDKDRKPVDPPVILQLEVDPDEDPLQLYITSPYLFVQAFLVGASDADPEPELNSLTGNTCTSGHVVKDDRGVHNMMFCLNDISIKKEGTYRLKFSLFKLNTSTGEAENLASISSQPFTTFSGRHFPGMSESTSMTRLLVDAGVRLRLRKESKGM
ncbi:velvet factor-domain-containing protein, partial [Coniella lustricola]